jgi:hypothetical protein
MADPPVAFVSWAHGDQEWEKTLAAFAFGLRANGIEAELDLFHLDSPEVDWSTYGRSRRASSS